MAPLPLETGVRRLPRYRSITSKFTIFTAVVVIWMAAVLLGSDWSRNGLEASRGWLAFLAVLLVAGAIARFSWKRLEYPLSRLEAGLAAVRKGELERIPVTRTGDRSKPSARASTA